MLVEVLFAGGLVVVTVVIHAVGFSALVRAILRSHALDRSGFWIVTGMLIGVTSWLMLIHLTEICVWGLFYCRQGWMPDAGTSFYFSGVTYTSLGYGDQLLPKPWRMLAPLETLTGILLCGLSTGLFFAIAHRWISNFMQRKTAGEPRSAAPMNE